MDIPKPTRHKYFIGIFFISAAVLMFELLLTRIFSVIFYYHFGFFAVSLALLGLGAGGLFVFRLKEKFKGHNWDSWLVYLSLIVASTLIINIVLLTNITISETNITGLPFTLLFLVSLINFLPFFFAGIIISLLFFKLPEHISHLYFFDLLGAALGSLLLAGSIAWLGAINSLIIIIIITLIAAMVFAWRKPTSVAKLIPWLSIGLIAVLIANIISPYLDINYHKTLTSNLIFSRWNAFSHVGVSKTDDSELLRIRIDADAATYIYNFEEDINQLNYLTDGIQGLVYKIKTSPQVLIIGPGGGVDVIIALLNNAQHVTGVEVNPIIIEDIMLGEFKNFSSNLYEDPRVNIIIDDGRSFIRRSDEKYDIILASLVDTWASSASGAFSLSENNLYTTEAFLDYLNHLNQDGILSFSRWVFTDQPKETLRLVAVTRAAAEKTGIENFSDHIILARQSLEVTNKVSLATMLFKKTPFTNEEINKIEQQIKAQNYKILYLPSNHVANEFTQLITTSNTQEFFFNYDLDVSPTTDDRPFFFFTTKLNQIYKTLSGGPYQNIGVFILFSLLAALILLSIIFLVIPLLFWLKNQKKYPRQLVYFSGIGFGFMFIEITLIQKFILLLGNPLYSLIIVLVSVLLFSGIGSALTSPIKSNNIKRFSNTIFIILISLTAVYAFYLSPLINILIPYSLNVRIFFSLLLIAPLGLFMGMPLPLGIKRISQVQPDLIPWVWGINGFFSVLGAALAILIAVYSGYTVVLTLGAISYMLVWISTFKPKS